MPDAPTQVQTTALVPQSSAQSTALASAGTSGGIVIAQWLVAPDWPPSLAVITVAVGILTPVAHLLGRALYTRLTRIADKLDGDETTTVTVSAEVQKP